MLNNSLLGAARGVARPAPRVIGLAGATLLLSAAPASANGAMGLALGTFGWDLWGIYVAAMVLFEALVMGRLLRVPLLGALGRSVWANFLTAILGGVVSGILSYIFLGVFGSRLNPNPFGQTLLLFTLFALASAPVEARVWLGAPTTTSKKPHHSRVLALSFAVHLLGVPLGLAVLLSPVRPYPGLEMQVGAQRHVFLQGELRGALNDYIGQHQALPPDLTYAEVLQRLRPDIDRFGRDPGLWAAAYRPIYHRFDLGEMRRAPVEWNARAAREKLFEGPPRTLWLSRSCSDGHCEGLVMELPGAMVGRHSDPVKLGYNGKVR